MRNRYKTVHAALQHLSIAILDNRHTAEAHCAEAPSTPSKHIAEKHVAHCAEASSHIVEVLL